MTKFVLARPGAPWDYPTLGFTADADGAILDGTLFDPDLTIPPDVYWSVYGGASAETSITRYATPSEEFLDPTPETVAGWLLAYDTAANTYVATSPDDVIATTAWDTALSAAIATEVTTRGTPTNDDLAALELPGGQIESMYAQGFPAPISDPPTLTVSGPTGTAPFVGDAYTYNNTKVRRAGCVPVTVTQLGSDYIQNQAIGVSGSGAKPWATDRVSNAKDIAVSFRSATTTVYAWVYVDGRPVGRAPLTITAGIGAGSKSWLRITFRESRLRHVRVELRNADYGGEVHTTGATVYRPLPQAQVRCAWVGDSWFDGAQEGGWPYTVSSVAARMLGWEPLHAGSGGTGYSTASSTSVFGSTARTDAVKAFAPHFIVVGGSQNDRTTAAATVGAAAAALYAKYATDLPSTKVIVVGPQPIPQASGGADATGVAMRDAIQTAALAAPNVLGFIDPIAGRWLTGTGAVDDPAGDGNGDIYVATDHLHPTAQGASFYARRIVSGVLALLANAGLPWDRWTGANIDPIETLAAVYTDNLVTDITVDSLSALADADPISTITPAAGTQVGALTQATGASQPAYVADDGDGKPAIRLYDSRHLDSTYGSPYVAGSPFTIFLVHKMVTRGGAGSFLIENRTAATGLAFLCTASTGYAFSSNTQTLVLPTQRADLDGSWRVDAFVLNGKMTHYANALTGVDSTMNTATGILGGIILGSAGSTGWEAKVRECVIYEGPLQVVEIKSMLTYLQSKWSTAALAA